MPERRIKMKKRREARTGREIKRKAE